MSDRTKKLTATAMICAIAYVMMVFGRVPVVMFLKYDPKDIVITLGGLIWGPLTALVSSVIVSLIEMITVSDTGIIGCIMNILSTCAFACTAAFIYKKKHTLAGAVIGLVAGTLAMTVIMLLWNYLITPIYMVMDRAVIAGMLIPVFLPFNLIKAGLNAAGTFLLYKPVSTALRSAGFVTAGENTPNKRPIGLWIVAGVILITCILLILIYNGII